MVVSSCFTYSVLRDVYAEQITCLYCADTTPILKALKSYTEYKQHRDVSIKNTRMFYGKTWGCFYAKHPGVFI